MGFSLNKAIAQVTTNLNVKIKAVQSIVIKDADVDLTFDDPDHYLNGVEVTKTGHLTITSSGVFTVSVQAAGDLTKSGGGTIPIGNVEITTTATGTPAFTGTPSFVAGTPLTTGPLVVAHSDTGITAGTVDVTYKAVGGAPFLNKADGTYTTVLTYTIAAN